ncbi:MAG: hypothetical protein ACRYFX_06315 [Janthinobacterium lividum]
MFLPLRQVPGHWKALLLSLGLLLAVAGPAAAQQLPILADTAAARPDTAVALRRLFAAQRRGTGKGIVGAGVGILFFNYLLAFSQQETTYQRIAGGLVAGEIGLGVFNLTTAIVRARRYRPTREKELLAALAQGQPLPWRIRKKLVADYYKRKPATPPPHD